MYNLCQLQHALKTLTVEAHFLPESNENRLGRLLNSVKHVTIHEPDLGTEIIPEKDLGYYYAKLLRSTYDDGLPTTISYHALCSDNTVYLFIPFEEMCHHCGDIYGNQNSIGIERLVCDGINQERAVAIQAILAATLLKRFHLSVESVVPRKYWKTIPKESPSRLLAGLYGGWDGFISTVQLCYNNSIFITYLL